MVNQSISFEELSKEEIKKRAAEWITDPIAMARLQERRNQVEYEINERKRKDRESRRCKCWSGHCIWHEPMDF